MSFKKAVDKLDSFAERRFFPLVWIPVAFLFVLVFSMSTSPLYVSEGWDSNIFKEIGLAITQGKTLYVDIFDHKGPVIFFIDALGQTLIPGRTGIFILQVIVMSVVLVYLYRMARLFVGGFLSTVSVLLALVFYSGVYYEGNLTEEWGLVAVVIAMYYSMRYLLRDSGPGAETPAPHPYWLSVVYGACFSFMFYMRPNDAVSTVGGVMFGVFLYLLWTRQFKNAIVNALCFLGTFVVVTIPWIVYFASKGALDAFWYGLVTHNSMYTNGLLPFFKSCLGHEKLMFFFVFLAACVLAYKTPEKKVLFVMVPVSIFGWILMGWLMFGHYAIPFVPIILIFWACLFRQGSISTALLALALLYCGSHGGGNMNYIEGTHLALRDRVEQIRTGDRDNRAFCTECRKLIDAIPESERDSIWNLNLMWTKYPLASIFFHNGLVQCNRIVHFPHYVVDPALKEQDNIRRFNPQWILLSHSSDHNPYWESLIGPMFAPDYEYIEENYEFVLQTDPAICDIELYRRKQ